MMGAPSFAKADCMPEIELIDNVQKPVISIDDHECLQSCRWRSYYVCKD